MNKDYNIEELVGQFDFRKNELVDVGTGLLLTNGEIAVLKRFEIDYENCFSLKELLYKIENIIDIEDDVEDLDAISLSIAERDYYQNTNK